MNLMIFLSTMNLMLFCKKSPLKLLMLVDGWRKSVFQTKIKQRQHPRAQVLLLFVGLALTGTGKTNFYPHLDSSTRPKSIWAEKGVFRTGTKLYYFLKNRRLEHKISKKRFLKIRFLLKTPFFAQNAFFCSIF